MPRVIRTWPVAVLVSVSVGQAATPLQTLAPAPGPAHLLVEDGTARGSIVLPQGADELEQHAANELQRYVKTMTGVTLQIVSEPERPAGYGIWLGRTEAARSAGFTLTESRLGRDGYAAEATDKDLVIVGRCPIGTLFGVYDLIEREFGVRWCEPDKKLGEVVPTGKTLSVGSFRREFKPSFDYRWVGDGDWALKQRMNVKVTVNGKPVGVNWKWHFHTFRTLIPPEEYFDKRPEWFPLIGGTRRKPKDKSSLDTQLCTSNPQVVAKLVEGLLQALDADPTIEIITLSPNDGGGFCECPNCKALDEPGRGWFARYSKRLAVLNEQIAKRVAERYPQVKIKVGAYAMYAELPGIEGYKPAPNLIVHLCHLHFCHNHPITGGRCQAGKTYHLPIGNFLPNQEFAELLKRWRSVTDNLFIYEYYALGGWSKEKLLWPMVHTMRHDLPWYRQMGVKGFYTQVGPWPRAPLNDYIAAKLAWNADLDVDWLIDDFCRRFFQEAADPMRRYLLGIEEAMVRCNQCISYGLVDGLAKAAGPRVFGKGTLEELRSFLDQAAQQATTDPVRHRIAAVRKAFDECERSVSAMK